MSIDLPEMRKWALEMERSAEVQMANSGGDKDLMSSAFGSSRVALLLARAADAIDSLTTERDAARAELQACEKELGERSDDLERIRSLVPGANWLAPTFDVISAELAKVTAELAKAGIQTGPRLSLDEAVAQLRGERDRWREKFEAATNASGADSPHSAAGDAQSEESNADANNRQNRDPEGPHLEQQRRASGDGDPRVHARLREPDGVPGCGHSVPVDQRQAVRDAGSGGGVPLSAGGAPIGAGGVLATTQLTTADLWADKIPEDRLP